MYTYKHWVLVEVRPNPESLPFVQGEISAANAQNARLFLNQEILRRDPFQTPNAQGWYVDHGQRFVTGDVTWYGEHPCKR